ncbi:hypothetical protein [Hymenobacter antarcticus]
MALSFPTAPLVAGRPTLSAARARLADVLNHPAFAAERRHKAGELMGTATDPQQVSRWAALALRESEQWENATLAREEAQPGPPAHPAYPH